MLSYESLAYLSLIAPDGKHYHIHKEFNTLRWPNYNIRSHESRLLRYKAKKNNLMFMWSGCDLPFHIDFSSTHTHIPYTTGIALEPYTQKPNRHEEFMSTSRLYSRSLSSCTAPFSHYDQNTTTRRMKQKVIGSNHSTNMWILCKCILFLPVIHINSDQYTHLDDLRNMR